MSNLEFLKMQERSKRFQLKSVTSQHEASDVIDAHDNFIPR